jgi:Tfp pilus assembly protein PilX
MRARGASLFSVSSVFLLPSRGGRAEPPSTIGGSAAEPAEPGFILVAALVALVIIALIVTGAFFASGQEVVIARNELRDQQVFAYAEYAAAKALESWNAPARDSMIVGQSQRLATISRGLLESDVYVTKLDTGLYLVSADGKLRSTDASGLRRRIGVLVRTIRDGASVNPPIRVSGHPWSELY